MKTEELIARVRQLVTPPTPEEVEELCFRLERLEGEVALLRELETICRNREYMFADWLTELKVPNALRALDDFRKRSK